jgi:TolB protein
VFLFGCEAQVHGVERSRSRRRFNPARAPPISEDVTRRPESEVLALVYRRSGRLKRRRRMVRGAGAGAALAILAGVASIVGRSPEHPAKHVVARAPSTVPAASSSAGPTPAACVCALPPSVKRHLRATLAQEVERGTFTPSGVAASTPFAFASDRSGNWDIYSMDANGSHLRRLTSDPAPERDPAWSPDGRHLAFVRLARVTDLVGAIFTMDADGSHLRQVAAGARPQWSPDGARLVFHDYPVGNAGGSGGRIWTVRSDGTDKRSVVSLGADATWTPDGTHLVYGGLDNAATNVAVIAVDGSGQRFMTANPVFACQPAVAANGRIAYIALASRTFALNTMDADGSYQTQITYSSNFEIRPSWSPDGSIIAVERGAEFDPHSTPLGVFSGQTGRSRIVFVASDGSSERELPSGDHDDADPAFPAGRS